MATNKNNDESTPKFSNKKHGDAKATNTIAMRAAIGIITLILAVAGITTSSSTPMAAAQTTLEENDGAREYGGTTAAFFPDDNETKRLSILGALGISVVEGVKVKAIALNEDESEVTVTVSSVPDNSTATTSSFGKSNGTNTTTTTTTTPGVTVAAFKTQLDLASLLQGQMMMGKSQEVMAQTDTKEGAAQGDKMMQNHSQMGMMARSGMPMFDIMSFIESLEIGSNIEHEGWISPAQLTVPVISSNTAAANATTNMTAQSGTSDTEIVIVVVIPYTGETETAAAAHAGEQVPINPLNQERQNR